MGLCYSCSTLLVDLDIGAEQCLGEHAVTARKIRLPTAFKLLGELGTGSEGVIYRVEKRKDKTQHAAKVVPRGHPGMAKFLKMELQNHACLQHPFVVRLDSLHMSKSHVIMIMECAEGGDFEDVVMQSKRHSDELLLSEEKARYFFRQLIAAVGYCHTQGVAHRDIKLGNVLVTGGALPRLKLCDFGLSSRDPPDDPARDKAKYQPRRTTMTGTPSYMAPEVLDVVPEVPYDPRQGDVWSCGVFLYVMLTGTYPQFDLDKCEWRAVREAKVRAMAAAAKKEEAEADNGPSKKRKGSGKKKGRSRSKEAKGEPDYLELAAGGTNAKELRFPDNFRDVQRSLASQNVHKGSTNTYSAMDAAPGELWDSHLEDCGVSEEAIDLLRGCLHMDPEARFTVEQIVAHPWFRKELQAEFRDALGAELEGETLVGDRPLAKPLVDTPLKKRSMEELAELVKQATNMWDWGDSGRQSWEAVEWDKYEARAGGTAL